MNGPEKPIIIGEMCKSHQIRLVRRAGFLENDPWRALLIACQVALFQGATATDSVHRKIEGRIERIPELGCLGCRLPGKFNELEKVAGMGDLGQIKALGESWVEKYRNKDDDTNTGTSDS